MVTGTPVSPEETRLGWIGTGVMGASMCGHLQTAGYRMTVFNRTRGKAQPVLDRGAAWAGSPREVALAADVVFIIVGYPRDVRDVILGPQGVLAGSRPGMIVVDMTTSEPALAVEIAAAAGARGVASLDAPVSGGDVGAREAKLSIMIGGDAAVAEALTPCWQTLGRTHVWQGAPGAGQHAKLANQVLIAGNMLGVCEALLYAQGAGLDLNRVLESVSSGAAGSWSLSNLAPRIIAGDFAPGFLVEHFVKDLGIALAESQRMGLKLRGLELAEELYRRTVELGHGRDGTQALALALAEMQ